MKIKKSPKALGALMSDVYRKIGMTEAYEEYKTLHLWNGVVGDAISRVTTVEKMTDGDLYVKVRNPSWRMELNFRKRDIVARLNKAIGYEMIRTIIFR
jgi:predicted nucleic acid-binding Zn ribbon protein